MQEVFRPSQLVLGKQVRDREPTRANPCLQANRHSVCIFLSRREHDIVPCAGEASGGQERARINFNNRITNYFN